MLVDENEMSGGKGGRRLVVVGLAKGNEWMPWWFTLLPLRIYSFGSE